MRSIIDEYFLLHSKTACKLFNEHADKMPIIDYHNHLSPQEIAEDKMYENMTELWLGGDHYKWRAMRARGYSEELVTGRRNVTAVDSFIDEEELDYRRFLAYADTVQNLIGNPIYHWTHLELKRYFDIDDALTPDTADYIWDKCNQLLRLRRGWAEVCSFSSSSFFPVCYCTSATPFYVQSHGCKCNCWNRTIREWWIPATRMPH